MGRHLSEARPAAARHHSGEGTRALVAWVRHSLGDAGVRRMLALAGDDRPLEILEDSATWSSYDQSRALLEAAADVLGGASHLRTAGRGALVEQAGGGASLTEVMELFRNLGSVSELLRNIGGTSVKYSTVIAMEALEVGDDFGVVSAVGLPGYPRYRALCEFTMGLLAAGPLLFGLDEADIEELECETWGDARCVFRLDWNPTPASDRDTPDAIAERYRNEMVLVRHRLDSLRSTAQDLVCGDTVETVLDRITTRAGTAAQAQRYLLAVRPTARDDLRVHHEGFAGDDEARAAADEVLENQPDDHGGCRLIVDVASGRRHYGRLAAFNPDGAPFFPEERSLLAAYAGLAAVALDGATALEESRRQTTTARALLDLARSLADATTREEVAQRLAAAVPAVVDCDRAAVLLWDANAHTGSFVGSHNMPEGTRDFLRSFRIARGDTPIIDSLVEHPRPVLLDERTDDPFVQAVLATCQVGAAAVVPIVNGEHFHGAVCAAVSGGSARLEADSDLIERLTGLADQAATALRNAQLLEHIRHQALHDALTGTPNARLLENRMGVALGRADHEAETAALLFLDLDRFKEVNDTLGHHFGDRLLQAVAQRLGATLRADDTLARLGGDEFAVLLPGLAGPDDAEAAARKILVALADPFVLDGHRLFMSSSIGIAMAPADGHDYQTLLQRADAAMYRAKARGRGTYHLHTAGTPARRYTPLALEADLHSAIARHQLRVIYQPQVDLRTLRIVGAEALVRWEHPKLGLLPPDEFIPLAEETGLIVDIDTWVLRTACAQAAEWREAGLPPLRMAVNLSGRDLLSPALFGTVAEALVSAGIPPADLELEITERVVDSADMDLLAVVGRLKSLGVRIALDDFGTGSSGFGRLSRSLIDTLKIDRAFMNEATDVGADAPVLAAMISMGQTLGLEVVAEGVETSAQVAFLRAHGCDLVQGYFFSRPIDPGAFAGISHVSPEPVTAVAG